MLDGILDDLLTVSPGDRAKFAPIRSPFAAAETQEWRGFSPHSPLSPSSNREIVSPDDISTVPGDDRRYCRQCLRLNSTGYCVAERFRPTDDMPRRCDQFKWNGEPVPLSQLEESAILAWLEQIGETDVELIKETIQRCRDDLQARRYFLMRADDRSNP